MIYHGKAPYYECSSKGDKRFSAFYAFINGDTIENQYQKAKVFKEGTGFNWRLAKGKKALNQEEVSKIYSKLWDDYIDANPDLLQILLGCSGLSDIFGQEGHCCQATELWRIRNAKLNK